MHAWWVLNSAIYVPNLAQLKKITDQPYRPTGQPS